MREAEFSRSFASGSECLLCPNKCRISDGFRGRCLGRLSENGRLLAENYGSIVAANIDPIEKKPLYHFFPGTRILSIGTYGCNLSCSFCQNSDISQQRVTGKEFTPDQLLQLALSYPHNIGVAFTYNEPGIWFEFIVDSVPVLHKNGLQTVMVTNGYLEPEPWKIFCSLSDAMNIDLKSFSDDFYRTVCKGQLKPVLANIETACMLGVHVELTSLIVTGLNDNPDEFREMVSWIASISRDIPLHISRYFPRHLETAPPTSVETMKKCFESASEKLNYVYLGNLHSEVGQNTLCPKCKETIIRRSGYETQIRNPSFRCDCGYSIPVKTQSVLSVRGSRNAGSSE